MANSADQHIGANRQGSFHHQFSRHVQCAAVARRDQRRQAGAGQSETFLALQRLQQSRLSRQAGAGLDRNSGAACRPQCPLPGRHGAGPAISDVNELQQLRIAGGNALRDDKFDGEYFVRRIHLQHAAAGHQRQSRQSRSRAFGFQQLHHRGEEGRHHHQCRYRSQPGAGRADPGQHRQLHQFAAFGRWLFHPLPEDPEGRHHAPRTPARPTACRSRLAATKRFRCRRPPRRRSTWWAIRARRARPTPPPPARQAPPTPPPRPPIRPGA